jgi:hypothetical protein
VAGGRHGFSAVFGSIMDESRRRCMRARAAMITIPKNNNKNHSHLMHDLRRWITLDIFDNADNNRQQKALSRTLSPGIIDFIDAN